MPIVARNGVDFHVQLLGDGPPVAMLHGLVIGNLATWYFTAAHTLSRSHRVLLYDLRGHGRSGRAPTGYDLATMTADLGALLRELGDGPVALVGHSYGGLVALHYAARHPARVSRLALVDVPLSPSGIAVSLQPDLQDEQDLIAGLPEFLKASLTRGRRRARHLLGALEFLLRQSSLLEDLRREPDVTDELLARVTCPVLCLYGADSFFLPDSEGYLAGLADVRLEVLPGRHHLPLESAGLVSAQLQEFLNG